MNGLPGLTGFHRPQTIDQALELLTQLPGRVRILAGGTDILSLPREEQSLGGEFHLVDISGLGLDYITDKPDGVALGAAVSINAIVASPFFCGPFTALAEAGRAHSTHTIRNRATLGGNICTAAPGGDMLPALLALDAIFTIADSAGPKTVRAEEFFSGPNCTVLGPAQLLTGVFIPRPEAAATSCFLKLRRQQTSIDLALVNAAVRLSLDQGRCSEGRIALGAVGPVPFLAKKTEALLQGRPVDDETIARAAQSAARESSPLDDARASADYRRRMVAVLVEDALRQAVERSRS